MGIGAEREQSVANGGPTSAATGGMPGMQMQGERAMVSSEANSVPGFPQDAYMEGPAMQMDAMVQKPETDGFRAGWSGYMQGMMTVIRVLPPEAYERIQKLREEAQRNPGERPAEEMPGMKMPGQAPAPGSSR